jgi:hypothetical protein
MKRRCAIVKLGVILALHACAYGQTDTVVHGHRAQVTPVSHQRGLLNKNVQQSRRLKSHYKPLPQAYNAGVLTYFGGTPVVTSPYLGLRSEFDGSDLIVNLPSINEDLRLLKHRYILDQNLMKRLQKVPETPLIELSGQLCAVETYVNPYRGAVNNTLALKDAELDMVIHAHKWVLGFMAFAYDNSANTAFVRHRVSNSRLFLDKGFITLGNLQWSPLYITIGQYFAPFGRYQSHLITTPLTKILGGSKQQLVTLGFKQRGKNGILGSLFYFKGNSRNRGGNNGGFHLAYEFNQSPYQGAVGVSYLANLADADHLQITGHSGFIGFAAPLPAVAQQLQRTVPGVHGYFNFSYKNLDLLAELVSAARRFSALDLTYNTHGARPWAVNVEGSWHFKVAEKAVAFSAGYSHTGEALILQVPQHRIAAALKTSWWRDTIEAVELRHDIFYPSNSQASGRGFSVSSAYLGKTQTALTAKFSLYF